MSTDRPELTGVEGVPETFLSEALLATLPENLAPAPWTCSLSALVWGHRGGVPATQALPPLLRRDHKGLAVVGGMVRYQDTPVGAYDEVLGLVATREGRRPFGSVAFMSVDSPASLVGGRTNWAMPKALGAFKGEVGAGETFTASSDDGGTWEVSATPRVFGPAIPVATKGQAQQQFPGGRVGASRLRGKGRVRLAVVTVSVRSDGPLPTWLKPGRHLGALVEEATFSLEEPTFR